MFSQPADRLDSCQKNVTKRPANYPYVYQPPTMRGPIGEAMATRGNEHEHLVSRLRSPFDTYGDAHRARDDLPQPRPWRARGCRLAELATGPQPTGTAAVRARRRVLAGVPRSAVRR